MRLPSCNVVGIRLTARRMLKVAIRPRFDRPPENFQVQRVKYKVKPKILKNDQGPLKREKNVFWAILIFWGWGPPRPPKCNFTSWTSAHDFQFLSNCVEWYKNEVRSKIRLRETLTRKIPKMGHF